jgi:hypothetical protein
MADLFISVTGLAFLSRCHNLKFQPMLVRVRLSGPVQSLTSSLFSPRGSGQRTRASTAKQRLARHSLYVLTAHATWQSYMTGLSAPSTTNPCPPTSAEVHSPGICVRRHSTSFAVATQPHIVSEPNFALSRRVAPVESEIPTDLSRANVASASCIGKRDDGYHVEGTRMLLMTSGTFRHDALLTLDSKVSTLSSSI